ncbi:DUF4352 domain-containing protein [Haladaptatus sp. DYSN1]|uniref:DUF4352 domain-containing protein n=1 Tax=unclassified Haladaptatus TaxID=2622732 RepID=UPI0024061D5D|nr:DUF4352 domain-containing protein [Haladaptatus sp. DYSN1]
MTFHQFTRRQFLSTGAASLFAGCVGGAGRTAEKTETETPLTIAVGDLVETPSFSFVVRAVTKTKALTDSTRADRGNTFVVIRLAAKNIGDEVVHWLPSKEPYIADSNGNEYYLTDSTTTNALPKNHDLLPGEVSRGDVVYEVPMDAAGLTYSLDFTNRSEVALSNVTIDLESTVASVTDLEQSLETVHPLGEPVSNNDVRVTVTEVRTATELGDGITATEGHEFVLPTLEITNDRTDSIPISSFWNMRLKRETGLVYTADLWAWESLSNGFEVGSLDAGETERGELAFHISIDSKARYFMFDWYNLDADYAKAFWAL